MIMTNVKFKSVESPDENMIQEYGELELTFNLTREEQQYLFKRVPRGESPDKLLEYLLKIQRWDLFQRFKKDIPIEEIVKKSHPQFFIWGEKNGK